MLDGMRSGAQSWGIKLAFGLIILVFIFWGIGSNTSTSGIVAKVNGEPITINEFQQAYSQMANEIKSVIPDITEEQLQNFGLENRVLQNLVINKLFITESKRLGIDVSIAELRSAIMEVPFFHDETGKFSPKLYEERLKQAGQTTAIFEKSLRSDLLPQKFEQVLTAGIFADKDIARKMYAFQGEKRSMEYVVFPFKPSEQKISDEEAQKIYEERKQAYVVPAQTSLEYISFTPGLLADENTIKDDEVKSFYEQNLTKYSEPEQVKARHILLMVDQNAPKEKNDEVLAKIKEIASQIKTVDDFAKMAKEYGQDGTKNSGGDLGWFGREQMVSEFAEVAFSLPVAKLSEPVRTQFGYHLIWVDEKKQAKQKSFEEVKDDIRYELAVQKVNNSLQDIVDATLASAMAQGDLTKEAKKLNLKVEKTGFVDAQNLIDNFGIKQSDVDILMGLADGTIWDSPLSVKGELSVVRVVKNKKTTTKSFDEVKKEIVQELQLKKAQEVALAEAEKTVGTYKDNVTPNTVKVSKYFTREGQIEGLGLLPDLAKQLFETDNNEWIKTAYLTDDGAIVARLKNIKKANMNNYKDVEKDVLANMQDAQKNMLFQAFILMLNKEAKVDILMPEIFQKSKKN